VSSLSISRRDILRSLSIGVAASSVLRVIPLEAAEHVHRMVTAEKSANPAAYVPKFFSAHDYKTLRALCATIFPADEHSGGALEGGAPEFIDLITSENPEFQTKLGGGFLWLDSTCADHYGQAFLECSPENQKGILDLIAYRKNAETNAGLSQGIEFFAFLRRLTSDAYFSSKAGIEYLGYIGNTFVREFPGCPPVPES
jgi:hypothetical protein